MSVSLASNFLHQRAGVLWTPLVSSVIKFVWYFQGLMLPFRGEEELTMLLAAVCY